MFLYFLQKKKKILAESGLFIFKPDKSIQDGRETVGWMVRNLHGSRMKEFWRNPMLKMRKQILQNKNQILVTVTISLPFLKP
jgi:cytoplasmic iron level regulating protein YaaA (DUF328/UPF0246 family)